MGGTNGKPERSSSEEAELARRLETLERRLDEERAGREVDSSAPPTFPGMGVAVRLATDFLAGILLGGALGWGFDRLFGTSPWGLMVFLVLGFVAAVLNVLRSAGLVKPGPAGPDHPAGAE